MAEKRRGLGRGLGALIPSAPTGDARPVDVFFPGGPAAKVSPEEADVPPTQDDTAGEDHTAAEPTRDTASAAAITTPEGQPTAPSADGETDEGTADDGPSTTSSTDSSPATGATAPTSSDDGAGGPAVAGSADGPAAELPEGLVPVPGVHFAEVPVGSIRPNPRQPRTVFDEDALSELVSSIREIGVLQPIVVRPLREDGAEHDGFTYELIMGERRWRATQEAGLETVPAIVRETDDADLLRDALLENLHRSQLNPLEEAAAYQQLLDDFGCTHDDLARRIHRSRPQISNTLRLLRLPPLVQRRVAAGVLSAGHARALLGLPDAAAMERLAQRIVAEGLSVRATEEIVTLGGDPEKPAVQRRPRAGDRNAALDDLAGRLSDRFDTRVKIALGKSKGRLTVEFASVQDLNRILETLSPEDPGLLR
ncbi:ParB/RepB/Spo0J family partition protein [Actinotalea sp. BY-33]|uniref:ParB/RepB/Spo0J family partition protein n=1 Tax=Actinotalea soli TaxID=2819234 RepID=A0A939LMW2_9CELL|nr:ParB/RepB/Spo0J family partition protein [Actinotalea soli]MBO1751167.1 ParB/RepB/Spo0J family partition protein [Actinotalea soli]